MRKALSSSFSRSGLRKAFLVSVTFSICMVVLRVYSTTMYEIFTHTAKEPQKGPWVTRPDNWGKCLAHTKKFNENPSQRWRGLPYPTGETSKVKGCIVSLVGSGASYQSEFKKGLKSLETQFNDMYHYPIFAFHFNLNDEEMQSIKATTRSPIEFIHIDRPSPDDPVSELNPEKILASNQALYSFPLEYRFQSYFFFDTLFNHPKVQEYNYIMRIDNDIDILPPINFDPFVFMEQNGIVLGIRHWSNDPIEICGGMYGPIELYKKEMLGWTEKPDRPLPPKCYCGGGATFFAYAPFFRSPQVKSFWNYIKCLGGIWTNRWAEQNLFPMAMSLLADDPEKRYHAFTNFAVHHKGVLFQPHTSWGLPDWPYHPAIGDDKTIALNTTMVHYRRGCIIYFAAQTELEFLKQSLINLEFHFLWKFKYPVFIFSNDITEESMVQLKTVVNPTITELNFHRVEVDRQRFLLIDMFEQPALAEYGYFMRIDPRTNLLTTIHWDIFRFMEDRRFLLGYHRYNAPDYASELDPPNNPDIWTSAVDIVKQMGPPFSKRNLTPVNFKYSLQHFAMGSMDFFRSEKYLNFIKKLPPSTHSSHGFPLAISALEDEVWKKIGDLSTLMMNWGTSDNIPFFQKAWWGPQEPIPMWPYKYVNRGIPCAV